MTLPLGNFGQVIIPSQLMHVGRLGLAASAERATLSAFGHLAPQLVVEVHNEVFVSLHNNMKWSAMLCFPRVLMIGKAKLKTVQPPGSS